MCVFFIVVVVLFCYKYFRSGSRACVVILQPDRVAQSVARLTHEPEVPGLIPGPATYFRFSFRSFKKGSCQLLAKVCARSIG